MEHIRKAIQACNFPPWALNTLQHKFNSKHNTHNGQTTIGNQSNNNNGSISINISVVVPYIHRLGKGSKGHATTWESRCTSKGVTPLKPSSWLLRTRSTNFKKMESYIGLNAHRSTVWMNTQGNQAEHLGTD